MQLTQAVGKASALLGAIDKNLRDEIGIAAITSIQGGAASFALDPLEQAIESTARVMRDELEHMAQTGMTMAGNFPSTPTYRRMTDHLDLLLAAQLKRVTANAAL